MDSFFDAALFALKVWFALFVGLLLVAVAL